MRCEPHARELVTLRVLARTCVSVRRAPHRRAQNCAYVYDDCQYCTYRSGDRIDDTDPCAWALHRCDQDEQNYC